MLVCKDGMCYEVAYGPTVYKHWNVKRAMCEHPSGEYRR